MSDLRNREIIKDKGFLSLSHEGSECTRPISLEKRLKNFSKLYSMFCFVLVVTLWPPNTPTTNTTTALCNFKHLLECSREAKSLRSLSMIYSLLKSVQSFKRQLSENIGHWVGARRRLGAGPQCALCCRSGADGTHHIPRQMPQMLEQHALKCNGAEPAAAATLWKSELTRASGMRRFWGETYSFLADCQHHPKCINRADEYPC